MNLKLDFKKINLIALIIAMILFAIDFKNKSNYLIIFIFGFSIIYGYLEKVKVKITIELIILASAMTIYFFIYQYYYEISAQAFITFWIGPILGYLSGLIIGKLNTEVIKKIILSIIIGFTAHGTINMYLYFKNGGMGRLIPEVWSGKFIVATLQNALFVPLIAVMAASIYIFRKIRYKIVIFTLGMTALFFSIETASRTLIYICILMYIINISIDYCFNMKNYRKIIKTMIGIITIVIVLNYIYKYNLFGIREYLENSDLMMRFKTQNINQIDPRYNAQVEVIRNMFRYPMGGREYYIGLKYAHNFWLDIIYTGGIIPGILMIVYYICTIITIIRGAIKRNIEKWELHIYGSIYLGLILVFANEPILDGEPYLFIIMTLFNGIYNARIYKKECDKKNDKKDDKENILFHQKS